MASKTFLVAQREYAEFVRTKTFWIGILAFPAIIALAIGIGWLMNRTKAVQEYAVLDTTVGQVAGAVEQAARRADLEQTLAALQPKKQQQAPPPKEPPEGQAPPPPPEPTLAELQQQLTDSEQKLPPDHPLRSLIALLRAHPEDLQALMQAARDGRLRDLPPELNQRLNGWVASLPPEQLKQMATMLTVRKYRHVSLRDLGIADLKPDDQRQRLKDMVKEGRLFAYFEFRGDPAQQDAPDPATYTYVSNNLTDDDLQDWYANAATQVVRQLRIAKAEIAPRTAQWIQEPVRFVAKQVDETGAIEEVKKEQKAGKFAPVVFVYLLWIAVFTAAQMLLTNTVEEKSNRIIEVLLSSASPGQLMAGKIWGIGATGLTMVGSWVVFALIGINISERLIPQIAELNLLEIVGNPLYLASFLGYFLTGYLLFAAVLVAIGSVCNSLKEAQNLVQPVFILLMIPIFAMIPIVQEPNGLMAKVFTYIPLYTPFAMMNRASGPPAPWEYAVTTVIILVSVVVAFKAAGKIFRVGVLMTGKPPKLKEILGWLWRG